MDTVNEEFTDNQVLPPKMKTWKVVLLVVGAILLIVGGCLYVFRDSFFGSDNTEPNELDGLVLAYKSDSDAFAKDFSKIDITTLKDEASAKSIGIALTAAELSIAKMEKDIDGILTELGKASTTAALSQTDADIRNNYRSCYSGRKNGLDLISKGIANNILYLSAYYDLKGYENNVQNFIKLKDDLFAAEKRKDEKTIIDLAAKASASSLNLAGYLSKAYAVLKYQSLAVQAGVFRSLAVAFSNIGDSYVKKDPALLATANTQITSASKTLVGSEGQAVKDWQKWYTDNIEAHYISGQEQFDLSAASCKRVESTIKK